MSPPGSAGGTSSFDQKTVGMQSTNTQFLKAKVKSEFMQEFGIDLPKDPSFGTDAMTVRLPRRAAPADGLRQYAARFEEETGIELLFTGDRPPHPKPEPSSLTAADGPQLELLEQNAARRTSRTPSRDCPTSPK